MSLLRIAVVSLGLALTLAGCTCTGPRLKTAADCEPTGTEVCNSIDDDCDGAIDEDLEPLRCGVGACAREVPACQPGGAASCTPGAPTAEACNGVDDDCDGEVDEELMPTSCGVGECEVVQTTCVAGAPVACVPAPSTDELCNGRDDDCDGTVDEELLANASGDLRITDDPAASDFVYLGRSDTGFAVVWQDKRDGAKGQIYFAALDKQGQRARAQDTRVSNTLGSSAHPAVTWNGQGYGLVYSDDASGSREVSFQALSATGVPQGFPVQLTAGTGDSAWPDVVWTGQHYALAWDDERAGANKHDIYFQRFDEAGTRLGGEVRVTTDPAKQSYPILKWNGREFAVVWTDFRHSGNREIYLRRLAADGTPLGAEVRVTNQTGDSAWADLAWNDQDREWAVVWHDTRDGNAEVYFSRFDEQGARRGGEVRLTSASGFSGYPSIDWNGFQYGVSWQDDRSGTSAIYFAQLSAQGVKNGAELKLSTGTGAATYTTALWNGSTFAFGWRDDRNDPTGNTEIYFAYVGCPR